MRSFLELEHVTVRFAFGSALAAQLRGRPAELIAVDDVSLAVPRGQSVGIVGESGCGKSTLAKAIVGLVPVTAGGIRLEGQPLGEDRDRAITRRVQMVFQDPGSSLNPSLSVKKILGEILRVHQIVSPAGVDERCAELMDLVELPRAALGARPRVLSGGQRQRVAIARALALEPDILIADEAVAALDVSVQAPILNLLNTLRKTLSLTLLFISHDLAVVRHVSERVVVMYLGRVVEDRPCEELFTDARHPYSSALLSVAPKFGSKKVPGESALRGEPPSPLDLPTGCRFRTRCPRAQEVCAEAEPLLDGPSPAQRAACHFAWAELDLSRSGTVADVRR
jgi:oligopeptide/dipeptide ABC transporter ATP-binding protein